MKKRRLTGMLVVAAILMMTACSPKEESTALNTEALETERVTEVQSSGDSQPSAGSQDSTVSTMWEEKPEPIRMGAARNTAAQS